jgi:hypothetical protein
MPFNGTGTFNPLEPEYPATADTLIEADTRNALDADFAAGLSNCMTRDGQSTPTANLPMAGRKLTGLGAGTTNGDSLRYEQLFGTGVTLNEPRAATSPAASDNSTKLATTEMVQQAMIAQGPLYNAATALFLFNNC